MINISNQNKELPLVTSKCDGEIINMNRKALGVFAGFNVGKSIIPKVDKNAFFKNTMYRHKMDLIYTTDNKYKNAIMKVFTRYIMKSVDLVFLNDKYFENEENRYNIKRMFCLFVENLAEERLDINIDDLLDKIIEKLSLTRNLAHKPVSLKEKSGLIIGASPSLTEMLVISIITVLNELDFRAPVSIKAQKIDNYTELSFMQITKADYMVRNINTFLTISPALIPRIEFISSLCEKGSVKTEATLNNDALCISIKIPDVEVKEGKLKAFSIDRLSDREIEKYVSTIVY